jgi:hypothetical protein
MRAAIFEYIDRSVTMKCRLYLPPGKDKLKNHLFRATKRWPVISGVVDREGAPFVDAFSDAQQVVVSRLRDGRRRIIVRPARE